ncbi:MAG: apolipoprotein N-acyltransferase, partial [Gammaproteobacteria bacterium]|nr:apolipoprotein N-acyltransferase [Gammaproteobacteria bacterium]
LRAAGIDLAMAICWEIAYPATVAADARQADALVTISNDTWFGESIGPSQHFQIARMRAKENGRYLLRSTNDGITAIVDDKGEVVDRLPRFERGVLTGTFHTVSGTTPYSRWLHLPLWVVLSTCAVGVSLAHPTIRARVMALRR